MFAVQNTQNENQDSALVILEMTVMGIRTHAFELKACLLITFNLIFTFVA